VYEHGPIGAVDAAVREKNGAGQIRATKAGEKTGGWNGCVYHWDQRGEKEDHRLLARRTPPTKITEEGDRAVS